MFRSLATRLTATYVFAAILLVLIVIAAVTTFVLSTFGVLTREGSASVARQTPEEVRQQVVRDGSLVAAAPDIARHLTRPGLRIVVFARGPQGGIVTESAADDRGRAAVFVHRLPHLGRRLAFGPPDAAPPPDAGPPPDRGPPTHPGLRPPFGAQIDNAHLPPAWQYERMPPFPFGLNALLRFEPQTVNVPGGRVTIFPDPRLLATTINQFLIAMLPIGAFVVVAAWLLGRYIAGQALRPLMQTTASLKRFGEGDFTPRPIQSSERNEIGELVAAYNAAAAQVSAAFEERRAAELQMRYFVADAGHELRTPLTVIMGYIDVLRRRAAAEPNNVKIFDTMLAESRRMRALIEKLILLARLENAPAQTRDGATVDLAEIAAQVARAATSLHADREVRVERAGEAFVHGNEAELADAVGNLVENALKYAPESAVDVRVRAEGARVLVDVSDAGPGIALDEQGRVFDRFYRGRDRSGEAEGFGLGLAIAKRAVERAGGELTVASTPGSGCRFTIAVPAAA